MWRRWLDSPGPPQLDRWLAREFRAHRQFGPRDRRWYSDLLFGAARFGYLVLIARSLPAGTDCGPPALAEALAAVAASADDPNSIVAGLREIAGPEFFARLAIRLARSGVPAAELESAPVLAPAERAAWERRLDRLARPAGSPGPADLAGRLALAGIPLAYGPALAERVAESGWGPAELARFLDHQASRPPLWLRLNFPERAAGAIRLLESEGLSVRPHGRALAVHGDRFLAATRAHREGLIEVQDLASQAVGELVEARPGQIVWDACAGGGGKTMQLAAALRGRGAVHASDIRDYKLDELKRRARRAGFPNVRTWAWDGSAAPELPLEAARRAGFDRVLVDAPCSSSGTWRRNPDARFRLGLTGLLGLTALQQRLLAAAAGAIRPGGRLVYATCSWLVAEDEAVVRAFLAEHPGFELVSMGVLGSPAEDADTMFAAVLSRPAAGHGSIAGC